ncbi:MAG: CotH kinase family protein, partial [Deltaproteobacteria bacterium]|nr:CotH kinase family protein [Deltaproteobacteria bacterium]
LWLTETAGVDHVPLQLSDDGGTVTLLDPGRRVVDTLTWPALLDDSAYGRFPSGTPATAVTIFTTPGVENPVDPGIFTDPSDGLFLTDRLLRIDIEALQPAIAALFDEPYEYVPAAFVFDGMRFDVGLHLKGQAGSLRDPDEKAAWKIDMDWHVPGQRLRGLEKLTLNNMVQDASCIHETLAYELLRESDSPAPRTSWAEVYLNGEYRGLYLHVESEDDQFLERWFADPEGNLYEGEYGQDLTASWIDDLEIDEAGANDVADRSDLEALATLLARQPTEAEVPALEALVDVDRTVTAFAVEVVLGHWDGYVAYPNNWRVYHDPSTDQFTLLVSGVDQTFDSELALYTGSGDLFVWMLAIPSIRDRYSIALWDAADRLAALDVPAKAAAYEALILASFATDPYREATVADMQDEIADTVAFTADRPADVIGDLVP